MNLYEKIKAIYPSLEDKDFWDVIALQDNCDGKGAFIKAWNHPTLPRPTDEELA